MKRIVTKIGHVFCSEVEGVFKFYFQYVANDVHQLNSSVIRVFRTHYNLNDEPDLNTVVSDNVDFYAHTVLRRGIEQGLWHRIGKAGIMNSDSLSEVIFAQTQNQSIVYEPNAKLIEIDPLRNWYMWHLGDADSRFIGVLPAHLHDMVEVSYVFPPLSVIQRAKYGFYPEYCDVYLIRKRIPRPDAELFMKKLNDDGSMTYYHFHGEEALQQIEVRNGNVVFLDQNHRDEGDFHLVSKSFSDFIWRYNHYISEDEFLAAWSKHRFIYPEES